MDMAHFDFAETPQPWPPLMEFVGIDQRFSCAIESAASLPNKVERQFVN